MLRTTAPGPRSAAARRRLGVAGAASLLAVSSLLAVAAPAHADPVVADGSFVSHGGYDYRVAGGAPLLVSSWDAFGGAQPTTPLDDAAFASLRTVPADGTFIRGAGSGDVYRIAGGAPVYVSDWAGFGGARPTVAVDDADLDHAGQPGEWGHLRALPVDGTLIRATGALSSLVVYAGVPRGTEDQRPATVVDRAAIDRAGTGGVWNHLLADARSTPTPTPVATPTSTPTPTPTPVAASSVTAAVARPHAPVAGRPVTLTVTVTSAGDPAGGGVELRWNGRVRAAAVVRRDRTASFTFLAKNRAGSGAANVVQVRFLGTATAAPSSDDAFYRSRRATDATVAGSVRDAATGARIRGARIELAPTEQGYGDTTSVTTDARGRYAVRLQPGTYAVRAHRSAGGYLDARTPALVVQEGRAYRLDERLRRPVTTSGARTTRAVE